MRAPATHPSSLRDRRRTILLMLGLALGTVLALGACSSSTPATTTTSSAAGTTPGTVPGSTPGTSASASGTTPPGTATRPGTTSGTTPVSSTSTTKAGTPTSSVVVAADNAAYCARTDTARKEFAALDPTDEAAALTKYKTILGELTTLAPAAIQADWAAVNPVVQSAATLTDLKKLDAPELDAATKRIDAWSTANCGFSLSDE